jgi:CRISPR/Cas system CSM-associated protein Csm2 small subunit
MAKNQKEIWARIGRLKMLIAYEKGRKPSDYRVIAGFRNEIIMLYEILCPTPEKEEKQDA